MPAKLRRYGADADGPQSPEGLLISALLEIGEFTPERYHVSLADAEAWKKLWVFCAEYQASAGEAPALSLVDMRFPDFEFTPAVDPSWASRQLAQASANRRMRAGIAKVMAALGDEDIDEAYAALDQIGRPPAATRQPLSIFDHVLLSPEFDVSKIEVPWPTLGRATGGIAPSEFWLIAARLSAGKTWLLSQVAGHAAQCGYRVGFASCEMQAATIARRVHQVMLGRADASLLAALRSEDEGERKEVVDHIKATTPGGVDIYDPSMGRINTTGHVAAMCRDYDLVIVDHVGLMQTADGNRAIEDWRTMATISNVLREITLSTSTSIVAAAQVNREGERTGLRRKPPKVSTLSQSDALGQDADVVVMCQRNETRVMSMSAEKVRNGPSLQWFTRFEPAKNRWEEISSDRARELEAEDIANTEIL